MLGSRAQQSFDDHVNRPVGRFGHLSDRGDRSDPAQLARFRMVALAILERQERAGGRRPAPD